MRSCDFDLPIFDLTVTTLAAVAIKLALTPALLAIAVAFPLAFALTLALALALAFALALALATTRACKFGLVVTLAIFIFDALMDVW